MWIIYYTWIIYYIFIVNIIGFVYFLLTSSPSLPQWSDPPSALGLCLARSLSACPLPGFPHRRKPIDLIVQLPSSVCYCGSVFELIPVILNKFLRCTSLLPLSTTLFLLFKVHVYWVQNILQSTHVSLSPITLIIYNLIINVLILCW